MTIAWHDAIGAIGVALIVGSYFLLQIGWFRAGLRYSVANATGAAMILCSLIFNFNLAAFMVEAFWLAISIYGVRRSIAARKRNRA